MGALALLALILLFKAMGRRIRKDYRTGRSQRTKGYDGLAVKFAGIAVFSLLYVGFWRHDWIPAIGFAVFASAFAANFWLSKPSRS